ncbi:phospholipase A1 member A-like isoform X2 [Frankliniella occidentalis]|uniref:Phospholipase A1 member A-like isoform X2 n=1 Tax=Frankliniella occidentalis TaxID=133901 RepID=A0A6J1SVE2_FRAOC|nr:phospholipase A1 member A-like isoform X2 [Frankliniella occidentalis]
MLLRPPRAVGLWTIIVGVSLLNIANSLRLQFALPGFQADFSTSFGLGRSTFGSNSNSAVAGGSRGISSRSSNSYHDENFGPAGETPPSGPAASGLFGSGFLDLPSAPWGWSGPSAPSSSLSGGATLRSADSDAGAFASWSRADIPFAGSAGLVGQNDGIVFTLFTRKSSGPEQILLRDASSSLQQSTYDPKKKTKIITHGYSSNARPKSGSDLVKNAYLQAADVNVILVDWSAVDSHIYPLTVARSVPMAGAEIAELIKALVQQRGAREDDMHIIGHSLGAQIAGVAGSIALGPAGKGWITGLDPAGPLFEGKDPSQRLDETDAGFVEAIHTDGGYLGVVQPVGHVDYYVDGGMHRHPDCGRDVLGLCSHCFAFELLAHAIANNNSIVGVKCDGLPQSDCGGNERIALGISPNTKSRGSFLVESGLKPSSTLQNIGRGRSSSIFSSILDRLIQPQSGAPGGVQC